MTNYNLYKILFNVLFFYTLFFIRLIMTINIFNSIPITTFFFICDQFNYGQLVFMYYFVKPKFKKMNIILKSVSLLGLTISIYWLIRLEVVPILYIVYLITNNNNLLLIFKIDVYSSLFLGSLYILFLAYFCLNKLVYLYISQQKQLPKNHSGEPKQLNKTNEIEEIIV